MFLFILSSILIDLNECIDGLENVYWTFDKGNQEVYIQILKEKTYLYYQDLKNINISITHKQNQNITPKNGFLVPINSKLKIFANWTNYDDYILGFLDAENCNTIIYTSNEKDSIPLFLYLNQNICIYHFTKKSIIKINDKTYSKKVQIKGTEDFAYISTNSLSKSFKNEKIIINLDKITIFNDLNDTDNPKIAKNKNKIMYILSWMSLAIGFLVYIIIGLCAYGSPFSNKTIDKYCCGNAICIGEENLFLSIKEKKNDFFEKTISILENNTEQTKVLLQNLNLE